MNHKEGQTPKEIELPAGRLLCRGLRWSPQAKGKKKHVLALHGWLDNSMSFVPMAPFLDAQEMVAMDLPGHGLSDWRAVNARYYFTDWVADVTSLINALNWDKFTLIGHSMGAGIALLLAAVMPERIDQVVAIEGLGPLSTPREGTVKQLQKYLMDAQKREQRTDWSPKLYATREQMVAAWCAAVKGISREAATLIVNRGSRAIEGGYCWRYDSRLQAPSPFRYSEDQVGDFLVNTVASVLLISAENGFRDRYPSVEKRMQLLKKLKGVSLKGGHHLHMESPEQVAAVINQFWNDSPTVK